MKRKAWLTFPASLELVFETPPEQLWPKILKSKGGWKNKLLSQMPEDLSHGIDLLQQLGSIGCISYPDS